MKEVICTCCPKGCHLKVDEENGYAVTGNSCSRGAEYGKSEVLHPVRVLTSTVKLTGGSLRRCPVKTREAVSKDMLLPIMEALGHVTLVSPVKIGQVAVRNVCGSGVDVIVTRDL